jgi:hypothetical protein
MEETVRKIVPNIARFSGPLLRIQRFSVHSLLENFRKFRYI